MGGSRRTCEICGIRERYSAEKLFFARFPLQENVCKEWVKLVGKEDLVHVPIEKLHSLRFVCEKHFGKRDFTKTRTRLKKRAVPKHELTMPPLTEHQMIGFPFHVAVSQKSELPQSVPFSTVTVVQEPSGSVQLTGAKRKLFDELELPQSVPSSTVTVVQEPSGSVQLTGAKRKLIDELELPQSVPSSTVTVVQEPSGSVQLTGTKRKLFDELELPQSVPYSTVTIIQEPSGSVQPTEKKRKLCDKIEMPQSMPSSSVTMIEEPSGSFQSTGMKRKISDEVELSQSGPSSTVTVLQESSGSVQLTGIRKKLCNELELPQSVHSVTTTNVQEPSGSVQSTGMKRKLCDELDATPRKKKLIKVLKKTRCTLKSLKKSAKLIENLSSTVLKEIVVSALKNQKRKPQGKRWSTKNKISALAIFKRSPKTYRYLEHVIPLPSRKTLQNLLKKIPMEPGINGAVIKHLTKISGNLNNKNKLSVLLFDEIALKRRLIYNENNDKIEGFIDSGKEDERTSEVADHALVFLLQGVGKKFKQPLSFYFVKGTVSSQKLAVLIKENIRAVEKTGFNVLATVCDQGPTNVGGLKLLKEWSNGGENYFRVDDKEIFIIYDVPHLFKSIRNNFLNGTIKMDGKTAKWEHIVEVEEQNRSFLYLSKITPTHVRPKYRAKMKVKYAAQVLSQTVAAVLKLLAQSRNNESRKTELEETAYVVEQLNKLFDFANGPSSANDIKRKIRENVSERTNHVATWEEFYKKMSTIHFFNKNGTEARNIKCIAGWRVTLKSLRSVWNKVKELNFKYLNLRQLNQDALENLFGLIRQHSPTDKHPTCCGFMSALKTSIIAGMTAPHGKGMNCEKDSKILLTNFHDVIFGDEESVDVENRENESSAGLKEHSVQSQVVENPKGFSISSDNDTDIPTISLNDIEDMEIETDLTEIAQQPLVYVSGYLAYITLKKTQKFDCSNCKQSLTVKDHLDDPIYNIIQLREWWKDRTSLTYPSVNLCRMVETALQVFKNDVEPILHHYNICQWTVTMFHLNCDSSWVCHVHAQVLMKIMFVRLALIFIRRQCKILNLKFNEKEENLADVLKRGQQI